MSYYSIRFAVQTNIDVISGSTDPGDYSWVIDHSPLDEYDDKIIVWGGFESASWTWSSIPEFNQIEITGSLLTRVCESVNISASWFDEFHQLQIENMEVEDSATGSYSAMDSGSTGGTYYQRYFIDGVNIENNGTSLK